MTRGLDEGPEHRAVRLLGVLLDPGQGDEVRLARGQKEAQEVLLLEGHGIEDERAPLERQALGDAVGPDVERTAQALPPDLGQDPGQRGAGEFGRGEPVVHALNVSSGPPGSQFTVRKAVPMRPMPMLTRALRNHRP
ncbi:MAG: hypothetical protein MZV64_13205 [Ignavibacteriales bacterium]|nr:hypothetical protein [Ignavibacteriales bacterium]